MEINKGLLTVADFKFFKEELQDEVVKVALNR